MLLGGQTQNFVPSNLQNVVPPLTVTMSEHWLIYTGGVDGAGRGIHRLRSNLKDQKHIQIDMKSLMSLIWTYKRTDFNLLQIAEGLETRDHKWRDRDNFYETETSTNETETRDRDQACLET